jgi:hypothetical protein
LGLCRVGFRLDVRRAMPHTLTTSPRNFNLVFKTLKKKSHAPLSNVPHPSQHPRSQCTSSHNEHSASKADSSLLSPLRKSDDASAPKTASAGLKHVVRRDRRTGRREVKPMMRRGADCFLQNYHQVKRGAEGIVWC